MSTSSIPDRVLLSAELSYVADPEHRSLRYWYEEKAARQIGWSQFRAHAAAGGWTARRREYRDQVAAEVLTGLANRAAQAELAELADLQELRTTLVGTLRCERDPVTGERRFVVPPKSYESVARTLIEVDRRVSEKRLAVREHQVVRQDDEGSQAEELPFTSDEMRSIAHMLLAQRRTKRRAELNIVDDDAPNSAVG